VLLPVSFLCLDALINWKELILDEVHVANIAEAAAACLNVSLKRFQNLHARQTELSDLLADDLKEYTLQIKASNSAATLVTVELRAANPQNDEAHVFQVTHKGNKHYVEIGKVTRPAKR
jgi:dTDP-4-amino-4,6-dideoxygalactose transaminase